MDQQSFSKIGEGNYVVVFRSLLAENGKGYPQMAERMKKDYSLEDKKRFNLQSNQFS